MGFGPDPIFNRVNRSTITTTETHSTQANDYSVDDRRVVADGGSLAIGPGSNYSEEFTDARQDNSRYDYNSGIQVGDSASVQFVTQTTDPALALATGQTLIEVAETNRQLGADYMAGAAEITENALATGTQLARESLDAVTGASAGANALSEYALTVGAGLARDSMDAVTGASAGANALSEYALTVGAGLTQDALYAGERLNAEALAAGLRLNENAQELTYRTGADALAFADDQSARGYTAMRDALDFGDASQARAYDAADRALQGTMIFGQDALGFQNAALMGGLDLAGMTQLHLAEQAEADRLARERAQQDTNSLIRSTNELLAGTVGDKTNDSATAVAEKALQAALVGAAIIAAAMVIPKVFSK